MPYTELSTEREELLAVIHPDLHGPGEYYTPWIDHSLAHKTWWEILVGDITATGTVNFDIVQATDNGGSGAKLVVGKAMTRLTQAGGDGDNVVLGNLRTEELDVQGGFNWVRGHLTLGTASTNCSVAVYGRNPRYAPVSTAGVTEIF